MQNIRRKFIALGMTGALAAACLAGCGGTSTDTEDTASSAAEEAYAPTLDTGTSGTLTVAGSYEEFPALEKAFEDFKAYYPNIETSYQYVEDYAGELKTTLLSENAPGIFMTNNDVEGSSDYADILKYSEDLSDSSLKINMSGIREGLKETTDDGVMNAMPILSTSYGMLVNEDLLTEEGLEVPDTYKELEKVCEQLKEDGYDSPIMGYNGEVGLYDSLTIPELLSSEDGKLGEIDALNTLDPTAGDFIKNPLKLVEDFVTNAYVDPSACDQEITDAAESCMQRFLEGDVPIMFVSADALYDSGSLETDAFTYSFHIVPVDNKGGYYVSDTAESLSVNTKSHQVDIANEFLRFLSQESELDQLAEESGLITVTDNFSQDDRYASLGDYEDSRILYMETVGINSAALTEVRGAAYAIANGTMSLDEAMDNFGNFASGE